jgi:hypothetical protein
MLVQYGDFICIFGYIFVLFGGGGELFVAFFGVFYQGKNRVVNFVFFRGDSFVSSFLILSLKNCIFGGVA